MINVREREVCVVLCCVVLCVINKCFIFTRLYIQQSWWGHVVVVVVCVCVSNFIAFFSFTVCFSVFPKSWLKILFGVITATVNVALSCLNKDKKLENKDLQMNGNPKPNITFLVQDLISREEHGYEKVDHLLKLGQNSKTLWKPK